MTISFVNIGSIVTSVTTTLDVPYNASVTAGNLLLLCIHTKYAGSTPTTPSGWTQENQKTGGVGAQGNDSGDMILTVYSKIATGSESGNVTVTMSGTPNTNMGFILQYSKTTGTWETASTTGADGSAGTAWSVTGAADPGVKGGDMVLAVMSQNGNIALTWSSEAMSQTGITFGTMVERVDNASSSGSDSCIVVAEFPVSSGTSSAAPVFTMTGSSSGTNSPTGPGIILRLREATGITISCTVGALALGEHSVTIVPGAKSIACAVSALALGEPNVTIVAVTTIPCVTGALALGEHNATAAPGEKAIQCVVGALSLGEHTATIIPGGISVVCGVSSLALGEHTSVVANFTFVACAVGALSFTEHTSLVIPGGVNVACVTGALALGEVAAAVVPGGVSIACAVEDLALAEHSSTVVAGASTVVCSVSALALAERTTLVVPGPVTVTCTPSALALAERTVIVVPGGVTVTCTRSSLSLDEYFVGVSTVSGPTILCNAGTLSLTGFFVGAFVPTGFKIIHLYTKGRPTLSSVTAERPTLSTKGRVIEMEVPRE